MRMLLPYSFNTMKIIEMIVEKNDDISVKYIDESKLEELMITIMPDGQNCIWKLIEASNLQGVTNLIEFIKHTREGGKKGVPFFNTPDINGVTPLHLCEKNTYTMASEELLNLLGENIDLDHHASYT